MSDCLESTDGDVSTKVSEMMQEAEKTGVVLYLKQDRRWRLKASLMRHGGPSYSHWL